MTLTKAIDDLLTFVDAHWQTFDHERLNDFYALDAAVYVAARGLNLPNTDLPREDVTLDKEDVVFFGRTNLPVVRSFFPGGSETLTLLATEGWTADMKSLRQLAEPNEATRRPTDDASPKPKTLLSGWKDITTALGMTYGDRRKIKRLNDLRDGPIRNGGSGTWPEVSKNDLLSWWDRLATDQQEMANTRAGRRASPNAQYGYGRTGTVAPEIGGHIRKRRRKAGT